MPLQRTESQKAAARANGAKSKGTRPLNPTLAAAQNHRQHSFLAQSLVLPDESRDRFNALCDALWTEFNPQTPVEQIHVQRMIAAQWRLMRVLAFESAGMLQETATAAELAPTAIDGNIWHHPAARSAAAFRALHGNSGHGSVIQLSEMRYQRQFANAQSQLLKYRAAAASQHAKNAAVPGDLVHSKQNHTPHLPGDPPGQPGAPPRKADPLPPNPGPPDKPSPQKRPDPTAPYTEN